MTKLSLFILAAVVGLAIQPAAAKIIRGDAFITAMQDNTLSGKNADGNKFDVFFLPGGQATYQETSKKAVFGTWKIDKDGDVCVTWARATNADAGCFHVDINGSNVSWSNKDVSHHGGLLGEVAPMTMAKRTQ
jgi:hypothetical protein